MKNTKQKASIQSMNNDNLNLQAKNEEKGNTPGCRRINYNELCGKSIPIENEIQLRQLKLHGIKRQKVPEIQGLKKHRKNHSFACRKSSRF